VDGNKAGAILRVIFFKIYDKKILKIERVVTQNPSAKKLELCCFLSLKAVIFMQIHLLVLIVSFKYGAKLHISGCGHDGKSCQPCISSSNTATRGKQN
jgi:hypothetical protein